MLLEVKTLLRRGMRPTLKLTNVSYLYVAPLTHIKGELPDKCMTKASWKTMVCRE
jgi:hypothetical protein